MSEPKVRKMVNFLPRWRPSGSWLLIFLGFFLVIGSWSIAGPFDGIMDEREHIQRAAGASSGEIIGQPIPGWGAYQTTPAEYTADNCWLGDMAKSAACAPPLTPGGPRSDGTTAGRYFPAYYMAVGWPLNVWGGWTGLILARLISAALSAAFLAGAFLVLARWSRYGLMLAGLVVALSPMVVELGGFINPNGLEISAGIALFASGIPLMFGPRRGSITPLIWLAGISSVTMATLKVTGPLWLAVIAFVLLIPARMALVRQLWGLRLVKLWLAAIAGSVAVSGAWTIHTKAHEIIPLPYYSQLSPTQAALLEASRWVKWEGGYLHQIVGLMSWLDTRIFEPAYPVWWFAAASLIVPALAFGGRLDRWRLAALVAGAVGVPFLMQVARVNAMGFVTQARYFLPILVGVPLLAGFILERRAFSASQSASLTRLIVLALLPIQFIALVFTMGRWQHGVPKILSPHDLYPWSGDWQPQLGWATPLLTIVTGLLIVGFQLWHAPSRASVLADQPTADPSTISKQDGGRG